MIKILEIELINVGPHASLILPLTDGVNVILGRNGIGKSTLFDSLYLSMVGEPLRSVWGRPDMLRWGSKTGSVAMTMAVDGEKWIVTRTIPRGDRDSIVKDGDKESRINGCDKVNAKMAELTGVTQDSLRVSAFLPQDGALNLLYGTPVKRKEEFAKILKLGHLPICREAVATALSGMPMVMDHAPELEALQVRIRELEDNMPILEGVLHAVDREHSDAVSAWYAVAENDKKDDPIALAKRIEEKQRLLTQLRAEADALGKIAPPPAANTPNYAAAADYERAVRVITELEDVRGKLAMLVTVYEPDKVAVDGDSLRSMLAVLEKEHAGMARWIQLGSCPTCGTQVSVDKDKFNRLTEDMAIARKAVNDHKDQMSAYNAAMLKYQAYASTKTRLQERETTLSDELVQLGDRIEGFDPDAHTEAVRAEAEYKALARKAEEARSAQLIKSNQAARIEGELLSMANAPVREVLPQDVLDRAALVPQLKQTLDGAHATLTLAKSDLARAKARVEEIARCEQGDKTLAKERMIMEELRDLLHADALPKAMANQFKDTLAETVNAELSGLEQPFRVSVDSELAWTVEFRTGKGKAGAALSGGQQAILSTALRLALTDLLGGRIKLLALDEPSASLDQNNKSALVEALDAVKKRLRAKGVQLIVVSHDLDILRVADKEIRIGG